MGFYFLREPLLGEWSERPSTREGEILTPASICITSLCYKRQNRFLFLFYFFDRPVKEIVGERARRAAWRAQTTISSPFINNDLITLLSTWWVRLTTRAGLRHLKALGTGSFRGLILVWCIHVIFRIAVMFSRFSNDRWMKDTSAKQPINKTQLIDALCYWNRPYLVIYATLPT